MADHKQDQRIETVVTDLQRAQTHLAVLHAKAVALGKGFHAVANMLTGDAEGMFDGEAFQTKSKYRQRSYTIIWPSVDDIRQRLTEIDTARNAIAALEAQRKEPSV